jgi:hypothetical protein
MSIDRGDINKILILHLLKLLKLFRISIAIFFGLTLLFLLYLNLFLFDNCIIRVIFLFIIIFVDGYDFVETFFNLHCIVTQ